MKKIVCLTVLLFLWISTIQAQSQYGELVRIMVSPVKDGMIYKTGENVQFRIALYKFGQLMEGAEIEYSIGPEKMDPDIHKTITLKNGHITVNGGSMNEPGFLRCQVVYEENGKEYRNSGTAGIEPENIHPTTPLPDDFSAFWDENITQLEQIDLEPTFTLLPDKSTFHTNAYHVSFNNISGKIYGILTVPKKPGKYPAILHVPGAGVRPYHGANYNQDVIALQIGIHGIPVDLYDSSLYNDLRYGALSSYNRYHLDNRDQYYYKRVYLGCKKAVDFLHSLPEFDGENLGIMGGSQGGALSIITASLDNRIKYLVSFYPALCDLTGYLHGRAGGWPHLFQNSFTNTDEKIETSKYYDVVNFARNVSVPGFYSLGYNDNVCPPTSIYSALNSIGAPKQVSIYIDAAHWRYPEMHNEGMKWMLTQLGVSAEQDQ